MKATVENPRGSEEKLSPKDSVEGGDNALRGSVRAPEGFSEGKPEAVKPRGRSPKVLSLASPSGNPLGTFNILPRDFNEYSRKLP